MSGLGLHYFQGSDCLDTYGKHGKKSPILKMKSGVFTSVAIFNLRDISVQFIWKHFTNKQIVDSVVTNK